MSGCLVGVASCGCLVHGGGAAAFNPSAAPPRPFSDIFTPHHHRRIMARLAASIALLAAVALAAAPGAAARPLEAWLDRQRCPPPGFDALQDFNVTQ